MSKIRVLQFTNIINRNDFIDAIVRHTNSKHFEQFVAVWQKESNITYHGYPEEGVPFWVVKTKVGVVPFIKSAWKLSRILKEQKIDILHTHHYYETVVGLLARLFYPKVKLVFGRHYHLDFYLAAKGLKRRLYLGIESILTKYSSAVIVPSVLIKELMIKQKATAERIRIVHYGFNFQQPKYHSLPKQEIDAARRKYGWEGLYLVGNFSRHHFAKGIEYLLEGFKEFSKNVANARLILVGDGPHHQQIRAWVQQNNLTEKVEFLGWRKDGNYLMNLMDVIVHPTLSEAFPQTMIEVMALEKPLLITPVSGAYDVVKDGKNGVRIELRSSASIVEKLRLLYQDKLLAENIGVNAGAYVRDNFSLEKIVPQYENVYFEVMGKRL